MTRIPWKRARSYALASLVAFGALTAIADAASIQVNKSFSPSTVLLGANSTVTVQFQNNSTVSSATITGFKDDIGTMGGGAVIAASPGLANTCGGTPSIAGQVVTMNSGTIPIAADGSHPGLCTLTFSVQAAIAENSSNKILASDVTTSLGNPVSDVTQTLQVTSSPLTLTTTGPTITQIGSTSVITFKVTNPNAIALTNGVVTVTGNSAQTYSLSGASSSCGGSATINSGSVDATGLTIPASGSCTISVSITAAVTATVNWTIAASSITDDQAATNNAALATTSKFQAGSPTVTKSFATNPVAQGGTSVLTISMKNVLTDAALSSVSESDDLTTMGGETYATSPTPQITGTGCTGTLTLNNPTNTIISLSSGTIPANTTCKIVVTVNVPATEPISTETNTIPLGNFTGTPAGGTAVHAAGDVTKTLTIASGGGGGGSLTMTKAIATSKVASNTPDLVTLTFKEVGGTGMTAGSFIDNMPSSPVQLVAVTSGGIYAPTFAGCGSSSPTVAFSGSGGNTIVTGSNLAITGAGASCVVKFYVEFSGTSFTSQTDTNTVNAADVSFTGSAGSVSPGADASANISILPALTVSNYDASNSGMINTPLAVSLTISDPQAVTDTSVVITAKTTAGKTEVAPTPNFTFSGGCPGSLNSSDITIAGNRESFTVDIASIDASCTIGYDVIDETSQTGTFTPGNPTYQSATVTTPNTFTGTNNVVYYGVSNINITKAFSPNQIQVGGTSTADITLSVAQFGSQATTQADGVGLTDTLPSGMVFSATPNVTFSAGCQQSGQPAPAYNITGSAITISNVSLLTVLATLGNCDIYFDVSGTAAGGPTNTIAASAVSSTSGATNSQVAQATLTVSAGISLVKTFVNPSFAIGSTDYARFLVTNSASSTALASATLADTMPSQIVVASTTLGPAVGGDPALCGGTMTGSVGSNTFSLTGMTVPATSGGGSVPGTCVVYVLTEASGTAAPGSYTNTVAVGGLVAGTYSNQNPTSASVTLLAPTNPTMTKAFLPATVAPNVDSVLTITIDNTQASSAALSGMAFTDTLPTNVVISPVPGASTTCSGGSVTAVAGSGSVALSGGSVASGATCTVTVSVRSSTTGSYPNSIPAGALTTTQGATTTTPANATLTVAAPDVTLTKAFAPGTIPIGGTSTLTVTVANTASGAVSLSNLAFSDAFPANVVVASTPATTTSCGGTVTAVAGTGSLSLSGGAVAAAGTCTVTVAVTSATAGSYLNTIPASNVTTTEGATNGSPATATLIVPQPVTITKSFSPTPIVPGGTSVLTITLDNSAVGSIALTGVGLTDTLPANVTIAATPGVGTTCVGGTPSATAGTGSVSLAGGSLAAGATCTITVNVTSTTVGAHLNTIPASALSTTEGITNTSPATATLTVNNATDVTLTKSFSPTTIAPNGTSTLTISIANTGASSSNLTALAVSDTLPSGIMIAATPNLATTCPSGVASGLAGGSVVGVTGGTLAATATCTLSVSVTGATPGSYLNTIPASSITTNEGSTNASPATATLTIASPVTVGKTFSPTTIAAGGTSTLTVTVTNAGSNAVALTGLALNDALPAGMLIAPTPNGATTCTGATVTATAATGSLVLSGGTLAVGASCTVSASVTAAVSGSFVNTIPAANITTTQGVSNPSPATATLTSAPPVAISKSFSPTPILQGGTSVLTITLANNAPGSIALTGVGFGDTLPTNVVIAATPGVGTTCTGGTPSAAPHANSVSLTGASLGAGATCTLTVNVTSSIAAMYLNTIPTSALVSNEGITNTSPATATLTVNSATNVNLSKAFSPTTIEPNGTSTLTITVANTGVGSSNLTGLGVSDTLPAGLSISATPNLATTCSGATVTGNAGTKTVNLSGGALASGATCTVVVSVTGVVPNTYINTISAGSLSTDQGSTNGSDASATLTIAPPVTITKSFLPTAIVPGGISTMTIGIANTATGAIALTGVGLTDTFPANLTIAATPNATSNCTGTLTANAGSASVALSGGAIGAGASCSITVDVTSTTVGSDVNTIAANALTSTQGPSNSNPATATLTIGNATDVSLSKSFSPTTIGPNRTSTLTISIANTGASASNLTGLALSDTLPSGITIAATPNVATTCSSGVTSGLGGGSTVSVTGGTLAASATCTLSVSVTGATPGSYVNTIPVNSVSSMQGATNAAPATATLTIVPPVAIGKSFSPTPIVPGGTSVLTITLDNSAAGSIALAGVGLTDTLPANVTIAATPGVGTTCTGGTPSATAGTGSVSLAGASLASGATCTITVNVTSTTVGAHVNTIPANALSTTEGITNTSPATATLTVNSATDVALSKTFSPTTIGPNGISTLTISIANTGASASNLTGLALSDTLPSGITIATTPNLATTCGVGTPSGVGGGSTVGVTGGTLAASATCTLSVSVTGSTPGSYLNTIPTGSVTSTQGATNAAPATATLTIAPLASLTKSFSPATIVPGGVSTMTIGIDNTSASAVALTGVGLTDTFPSNLTVAATPNATTTCGGTVSATAGGTTLKLSSGAVAANTSCTISVNVMATVVGPLVNTIPTGALMTTQGTSNGSPVSSTLTVQDATNVTLGKAFSPITIASGGTSTLTITVANKGAGSSNLTALAVSDTLPAGITIASTPNLTTTCSAGLTSGVAGGSTIGLTGATLASGATCTIAVSVTGTTPNAYVNTIPANSVTSGQGATNASPATATLTIAPPVTISKAFSPASIPQHGSSTLTITVANAAAHAIALTGLAVTDTLPANVTIGATPGAATTCGGTTAATSGGATFGLSGGALGVGGTCTISVSVTSSTIGSHLNTIPVGAVTTNEGASNGTAANATLVVTASAKLSVSKSFSPAIVASGATSLLAIVIANNDPAAVALTGVALTDSLPTGLTIASVPNASTTCTAGTVTATAGAGPVVLAGATMAAGASCTVNVNVTGTVLGSYLNTIPVGGATSNEGSTNGLPATATLVIGAPNLTVTKSSTPQNASVAPGQTIGYTITVKNTGSIAETNAHVTDTPSGATLVGGSVAINGASAPDAVIASGQTFGTIAPGAIVSIAYRATVATNAAAGTIVGNNVVVGGDQPCTGTTCSASSPPNTVLIPHLSVSKLLDGKLSEIVVPGQRVTYSINISNSGATIAEQAFMTDPVPAGIVPIAGTVTLDGAPAAAATVVGQTITVPLGNLAPGAAATITFAATIEIASSTPIVNVVEVGALGLQNELISNPVQANSVTPAITVTKTTPATVVNSGDRVDYTIVMHGAPGVPYGTTVASDTLSDYEIYAPGTTRVNGQPLEPVVTGHLLTWTFPNLNGTITITYATVIGNGAPPNGDLTNTVNVIAQTSGAPGRGSASAVVRILATPFGSCFPITGRVYLDVHGSGRFDDGDTGVGGVTILLDDGELVTTDPTGRYDFPCVRPGMHALRLDESTLPAGMHPFDDRNIDSEKSIRRLVHRTFDATIIEDVNFAIQPDAPPATGSQPPKRR
jgi:uncharacterized repeat protein (TIGR01451 family)